MSYKQQLLVEKKQAEQQITRFQARLAQIQTLLDQIEAVDKSASAFLGIDQQDGVRSDVPPTIFGNLSIDDGAMPHTFDAVIRHETLPPPFDEIANNTGAETDDRAGFAVNKDESKESIGNATVKKKRKRSKAPEVIAFEVAATKILKNATKPLDRTEMYNEISSIGVEIPGDSERDKLNVLGSRMSRMENVVNVSVSMGRGYWLAERQGQLEGRSDKSDSRQTEINVFG